jgi:hypothetical protein
MRTRPTFRVVATLAGGLTLAMVPVTLAGATPTPHISAHPNSVMVNTDTTLVGKHFQPDTSLTLAECSQKNWVAPRNPCNTTNTVTVTTDTKGGFDTGFKVETCPGGVNKGPGFSERCFIGVPTPSGVDTVDLVGAVRITVTGP